MFGKLTMLSLQFEEISCSGKFQFREVSDSYRNFRLKVYANVGWYFSVFVEDFESQSILWIHFSNVLTCKSSLTRLTLTWITRALMKRCVYLRDPLDVF